MLCLFVVTFVSFRLSEPVLITDVSNVDLNVLLYFHHHDRFSTSLATSCSDSSSSLFPHPSSPLSSPPPLRMILGANTDASIDVSDPLSDHFYKEIWMSTCARNAAIYQKVRLALRVIGRVL